MAKNVTKDLTLHIFITNIYRESSQLVTIPPPFESEIFFM
jgi:hypothetical protein